VTPPPYRLHRSACNVYSFVIFLPWEIPSKFPTALTYIILLRGRFKENYLLGHSSLGKIPLDQFYGIKVPARDLQNRK
jgi:hypothetical protein